MIWEPAAKVVEVPEAVIEPSGDRVVVHLDERRFPQARAAHRVERGAFAFLLWEVAR